MTLNMIQRPTGSLPVEVTGFVGRRVELAQLTSLLAAARLVTVLGPGGVGKTRVALRAAQSVADQFRHGVCLVELAGLRDPELLPHTVAAALGLAEQDNRSRLDVLADYVRDQNLLLIFDTCEHLVDGCAMLADLLLRESAGVKVLATSRQPLDVPGEHTCAIAPFPVPDPDDPSEADDGADEGAVELFRQRAVAVVPGFVITAANRRDVVRLCRRLDGIPLAIELATVRLRAVPLDQLADRLEDRFRLLTGERRTAFPRHQTLRNALDWSHELCTEQERLLWRRLSVFTGTFDVPAAEQVCAGPGLPEGDVLEALIGLVDKSVVLRMDGPRNRYRQLDTIREFGADELLRSGERDEFRHRHLARYLAMARDFNDHLTDDDQLRRFAVLSDEHAEIRTALGYGLALPGQANAAARLCTWLWGYWQIGRMTEARYWLTKILFELDSGTLERAWCLAIRAYSAANQGDAATVIADLDEAESLAAQLGDDLLAGRIELYYNIACVLLGRAEQSAVHGQAAQAKMARAGDAVGLIHLDIVTGYQHFLTGDPELAMARGASALDRLGQQSQERWLSSYAHFMVAAGEFAAGAHDEALRECAIALRFKQDLNDTLGIAYCLEVFAWLAAAQSRPRRAAWLLGAAEVLWQRIGTRLSGAAAAEEVHARAVKQASVALGEEHYLTVVARGAGQPMNVIIDHACDDLDELGVGPAGRPAARPDLVLPVSVRDVLTAREWEVALLVAEGLSNQKIADRLVISKRTVDAHVEHIFAKLGVASRVLIACRVRSEQGLAEQPGLAE
jgi:predicted ATPase/DNA-binding CsgD family transcriptional regulator